MLNKSLLIIFKIFSFILIGTNTYAETLKIKCENDWWNVIIDTNKTNKILIHRVGHVIFKADDRRILQWSSDFNEGIIDLFSGRARVTKDNYTGGLLGHQFNCDISSGYKKDN